MRRDGHLNNRKLLLVSLLVASIICTWVLFDHSWPLHRANVTLSKFDPNGKSGHAELMDELYYLSRCEHLPKSVLCKVAPHVGSDDRAVSEMAVAVLYKNRSRRVSFQNDLPEKDPTRDDIQYQSLYVTGKPD